MFSVVKGCVWGLEGATVEKSKRLNQLDTVGYKACGLALFPKLWTPPFFVLSAELYRAWKTGIHEERANVLKQAAADLEPFVAAWAEKWPHGLAFRSSATSETLRDRGAYQSVELTADYGARTICTAIADIFSSFSELERNGAIAIVVQARVHLGLRGHLSNERRVSKTVNQWMWEQEMPTQASGRTNSQRSSPPSSSARITLRPDDTQILVHSLQSVGRWCTQLSLGPVHVEWGVAGINLWLFQIDREDDQPDSGFDPANFLRPTDPTPAGSPPTGGPFKVADFKGDTGWPKIDKVRNLTNGRSAPYPQLCFATGEEIERAMRSGRDVAAEVASITNNHAVCRTDCTSPKISKLNLPRTETVSASEVVAFMVTTLADLKGKGARADQICFILHKFIPSRVAAWALADPHRQVVLVDALWGLPDGLQYLVHDSFEYDVKVGSSSSETLRYKPYFLQEASTGAWELTPVKRHLARHRSISLPDVREVAMHTHRVAMQMGASVQIMWFCHVDPSATVGANIPWFMQSADALRPSGVQVIPEAAERITISTLEQLQGGHFANCVLELEPEAELFRDDAFLEAVARVALEYGVPVIIRGSTLSHAYYTLSRKGVTVAATANPRTRARQRQVFKKLVRDDIPARILEKGEQVSVARIAQSQSRAALVIKLHEEAQELLQATRPEDVTAELADLLEVVRSLCLATGTEFAVVEQAAEQKRNLRGSFERNVVLLETSRAAWKERASTEPQKTIALEDLAYVETHGRAHVANFTSVLGGHEASIELSSGSKIKVKLTSKGVELVEDPSTGSSSDQLSFQF